MPVCSFCRKRYKEPRGLTVFTFDGRSIYYCSGKCRKNVEHLHRDPKKTNWVIKRAGYLEKTGLSEIPEAVSENNVEEAEPVEKKDSEKAEHVEKAEPAEKKEKSDKKEKSEKKK